MYRVIHGEIQEEKQEYENMADNMDAWLRRLGTLGPPGKKMAPWIVTGNLGSGV